MRTLEQTRLLEDWLEAIRNLSQIDWKQAGFSMDYWVKGKLPESPMLGCGTVCCAYGVGTALKSWKKAGLGIQAKTRFNLYEPVDDARNILGLSSDEWNRITDPDSYDLEDWDTPIHPSEVAGRIYDALEAGKVEC